VAEVPRQPEAPDPGLEPGQALDLLERAVAAAVVDQDQLKVKPGPVTVSRQTR